MICWTPRVVFKPHCDCRLGFKQIDPFCFLGVRGKKWRTQWVRSHEGCAALCSRTLSRPLSSSPPCPSAPPALATSPLRKPPPIRSWTQCPHYLSNLRHHKTSIHNHNALSTIGPLRMASTWAFIRYVHSRCIIAFAFVFPCLFFFFLFFTSILVLDIEDFADWWIFGFDCGGGLL